MKKAIKTLICMALCSVLLVSLAACGPKPTKENLEGVWKYTNGDYYLYFEIDEYGNLVCTDTMGDREGFCYIDGWTVTVEYEDGYVQNGYVDGLIHKKIQKLKYKYTNGKLISESGAEYEKMD